MSNQTIMKTLLLSLFVILPLLPQQSFATNSVAEVHALMSRDLMTRMATYLDANPEATDKLTGINLVLEQLQKRNDYSGMLVWLQRRYEYYRTVTEVPKTHLIDQTIIPIQQIQYQLSQRLLAKKFAERMRTDWKGTPVFDEIDQKLAAIEKKYKMPDIGDPITGTFTDLDGKPVDLKDYLGDVVLLHFWVTNCDICKAQKETIKQALELYVPQGFSAIGFSQDQDLDGLKTFVAESGITWPQCYDADPKHQFAQKLRLVGVPSDFLLGRDGKVIAVNPRGTGLLEEINKAVNPTAIPPDGAPASVPAPAPAP